MTARRIDRVPPIIDGFLDDEVWREAPRVTGFTQRDPEEGEPATEQTTVQIVYDHEALYLGIACRDREPDKIVSRLVRRDQWVETDRVSVYLDPQHDHRTGYFFSVSPSGWTRDGVLYNDLGEDDTWDGVWEAKAAIHGEGWSAEYKIPYRALRFSRRAEYTWGINVLRWITRKQERDDWMLVRQGESGRVSRFGHLEGVENIDPPNHFEILPFVVGRSALQPETPAHPADKEWLASAGLDLRHGLTQDIAINATINPDFGQVETDPAVLNLSVFETFFEERRPFFVEGSTLFRVPESDKELARPSSYEFSPFDHLAENPDFSRRSLRGNAVLRWAYRPGSTFFLVWSQRRNAALDEVENPAFHPFEGAIRSFGDKGENILLVRFSYWLGL